MPEYVPTDDEDKDFVLNEDAADYLALPTNEPTSPTAPSPDYLEIPVINYDPVDDEFSLNCCDDDNDYLPPPSM